MFPQEDLVSVLIAVYNGEKYLKQALQSVFLQTYCPFEVIVIDDGSTDSSAVIARSFEQVKYHHQQNAGVAAARNAGLTRAEGEFIAFLDADDTWSADKLQIQIEFLRENPEAGIVFAHEQFFHEGDMERPAWIREQIWSSSHPAYVPSTMLSRANVFKKVGLFDLSFKTSPETEWIFRAKDMGIPVQMLPNVLLMRRIHDRNVSHVPQKQMLDRMRTLRASVRRQKAGNLGKA